MLAAQLSGIMNTDFVRVDGCQDGFAAGTIDPSATGSTLEIGFAHDEEVGWMFLSSGGLDSLCCDNLRSAGVAIPPQVMAQLFQC